MHKCYLIHRIFMTKKTSCMLHTCCNVGILSTAEVPLVVPYIFKYTNKNTRALQSHWGGTIVFTNNLQCFYIHAIVSPPF